MEKYNSDKNYIGFGWMMPITEKFYKLTKGFNYASYWHDIQYEQMLHYQKGFWSLYVVKFGLDIAFLIIGLTLCLKRFNFFGMLIGGILWFTLFISSPWIINNIHQNIKTG